MKDGIKGRGIAWLLLLRDYRRLWAAGLLVSVVRWLETLAVALFVIEVTQSAFLVTMMTLLRLLPMGLFGFLFGALAERVERALFLTGVMAASALASLAIALLAWGGALTVWHLALASFLNGLAWAADNPVRRMLIGQVVRPARMGQAMSIDVGTNNASRILGPTLGGALFAAFGVAGAFALGAALHGLALLACLTLRVRSGIVPAGRRPALIPGIAEGIAMAWRDPRLRGTLWVTIVFNIWGWPFTALVPVVAQEHLGLSAMATGVLASLDGVGAFAGALLLALLARPAQYAACYLGGAALYFVGILLFATAPIAALAGAALALNGLGQSGFAIMQATLIYLAAPPEMRSRLLGVLTVCIGLGPIGFLQLGLLAELFGARLACIITGAEGLVVLALTWRVWRPLLRGPAAS